MRTCFAIVVLRATLCGCGKPTPETLVRSGYDEQEMDAAFARARREVDSFIAELSKPTGTDHCVKVAIKDASGTEHFWLSDVSFQEGEFHERKERTCQEPFS